MKEIQFRPTATTFGSPIPYIANGTTIILVQDGKATVGRYEEPTDEEPSPSFSHPENEAQLEAEAKAIVMTNFPKALHSDRGFIFTCPNELATKAIWKIG